VVAEANVECYLTQWVVRASWYDLWKEQSVGLRNSCDMCIANSMFAYIRFIPLPASINTLSTFVPSYLCFEYQGRITWPRYCYWMVFSIEFYRLFDQCKYFVDTGGDVIARLTSREMLFCSLFDFGTRCIIALMCPLDEMYPPSFSFP
jgi:hypothetical protein